MEHLVTALKQTLYYYLEHINAYDYIMMAAVLAGFLIFMMFSLIAIFKSQVFGSLLLVVSVGILGAGAYFGYQIVDDKFRKRTLNIVNTTQLQYSNTFLLDLNLTNDSNKTFKNCRVNVQFNRTTNSKFRDFINVFKPIKLVFADSNTRIAPGSTIDFNITLYNFRPKNYNIFTWSQCF